MNFSLINWLAVVAAGLSSFIVGGIWYAQPVFGKAWMTDSKLTEENIKSGSMAKTFGFTAFFSLLMAVNLAMFLADAKTTAAWGAEAGFLAGIWTFCAIAIHSLFEQRSWRHIFINGLYSVVSLTLMGFIIGAWR
ncbi:MAG TPA: DUF1761 domain-containing protein [Mucilaginibacter sp.]|jgi:hypothetical protein|nr:DUF1761 domain-containing protein [Mucilaginibacter sp.]